MNRRTLLRTMSVAAASAALAGCTGTDDGSAGTDSSGNTGTGTGDNTGTAAQADVAAYIVRNAPDNPGPYEEAAGPLTNHESEELAVQNLQFQRAGQKGLVVAGDVTNRSDRAFGSVTVEVTLYDSNEDQNTILDSVKQQTEHGELEAGATWQWAATFEEEPPFEIDHYSVAATADYASESG